MKQQNIIIRVALPRDIPHLLELGEIYYSEAEQWKGFKFNKEKLEEYFNSAIRHPDHQIFLALSEGNLIGLMCCVVTDVPWSDDRLASDSFLYVDSDVRGNRVGRKLVENFEAWARACGAVLMMMGTNSGILDNKPAERIYESLEYSEGGRCFTKKLDNN